MLDDRNLAQLRIPKLSQSPKIRAHDVVQEWFGRQLSLVQGWGLGALGLLRGHARFSHPLYQLSSQQRLHLEDIRHS